MSQMEYDMSKTYIRHDSFIGRYIAIERHMYVSTQDGLCPQMVWHDDGTISVVTNDGKEVIYSMVEE